MKGKLTSEIRAEQTFLHLKKKPWYAILAVFLILSGLGLSVPFLFYGIKNPFEGIGNIRLARLGLCVALAALVVIIDAVRLKFLAHISDRSISLKSSVRIVLIYAFFAALTPTSLGGELSMAYLLARRGMKRGSAISVTMVRTLSTPATLLIFFPAAAFLLPGNLPHSHDRFLEVMGLVSIAALFALLFVRLYRKNLRARMEKTAEKSKNKPDFLRRVLLKAWNLYTEIEDAAGLMLRNGWFNILAVFVLTVVHLGCYYALAPACAGVFGVEIPFFEGILTMCMVHLIVYLTPTPAGSGVAEALFIVAFQHFLKGSEFLVVALWRLLSEYIRIPVGAICGLWEIGKIARKKA